MCDIYDVYERYEDESLEAGFDSVEEYLDFMCDDVFGVTVEEAFEKGLI